MVLALEFDTGHVCAVFGGEEAACGAEAGSDVQDLFIGLETEIRGAVFEGGVGFVVHAVEGGCVGVGPVGFVGEGGEDGLRPG